MSVDYLDANQAIRDAVHNRLAGTPADDPKMVGYAPQQETSADNYAQWTPPHALIDSIELPPQLKRHPMSCRFMELLDKLRELHDSKSADYGSEVDPLANIRQGAEFVNIEAWRGCLVRIADKVQRLRTYCRTGRLVHEGVFDTLLDLANYSLLAILLYEEEHEQS